MSTMNDDGLIQEFVSESLEHLAAIEPDLLILEKDGANVDQEIINRLFRAIHSIKGTSSFFGFESLKKLSHIMESLLMQIREKKLIPDPTVVEPLLLGVDKLRVLIEDVYSSDDVPCDEEIEKLEKVLKSHATKPQPLQLKSKEAPTDALPFTPDVETLQLAITHGHRLYMFTVRLDEDIDKKGRTPDELIEHLLSIGEIMDTYIGLDMVPDLDNALSQPMAIQILYTSVLEDDLLSMDLELEDSQFHLLDKKLFVEKLPGASSQLIPRKAKPESGAAASPGEESSEHDPEAPVVALDKPERKVASGPVESVETVRVRVNLLNNLMDLAGELVLSRNQLLRSADHELHPGSHVLNIIQNIDFLTTEIQEHIMLTRMQSVGFLFSKFPRVVRDMAKQLDKQIDIQISGEEVELDKSIIETLSDPLTHLIRNSCDHAIESPEERIAAGKPAKGTIDLRAFHEGGQIIISLNDDGRGIDHEKIVDKAIQKGFLTRTEADKMTPYERIHLIFLPGFSTADQISELSGRGVGMDVVKTNIERMGGHISVETKIGKGTTFLLRLPLTLAIIPALIVSTAAHFFALPQINVVELVRIRALDLTRKIDKVGQTNVLQLRGKLIPLLHLAQLMNLDRLFYDRTTGEYRPDRRYEISDARKDPATPEDLVESDGFNRRRSMESDYSIVVLKVGVNQFGLIVDQVIEMEEIVVKPLSAYLKNCKCFSGATILGDGQVALIVDVSGILQQAGLTFGEMDSLRLQLQMEKIRSSFHETAKQESVILFNNAPEELFAMPLSSLLRLEKIRPQEIQTIGDREFITYEGKTLPILRLEKHLQVSPSPANQEIGYLIIPKGDGYRVGIYASGIVDKLEAQYVLEDTPIGPSHICASTVIQDKVALFIDPLELIKASGLKIEPTP